MKPSAVFSVNRARLLGVLAFGVAASASLQAAETPAHDLYICLSMASDHTMGKRTERVSGLYISPDREELRHLGFNHPRQDTVAVDPRDPTVLFTVGLNGVLRSTDGGESWRIMTSWDMTEPKDLAIDPNRPDHLYIGLPDGVGVSTDGGQHWERRDTGIRRKYTQTIAVDRTQAGRVLAGTELGLYLSEDAGQNWKRVLATTKTVTDVAQSPHDPAHWILSTQAEGAWQSHDGGRSWQRFRALPGASTLHNIVFDPHDPQRMALSGWELGVRLTEDGGQTWSDRTAGLPSPHVWRVTFDPDFPERLYAGPHEQAIHVSHDTGRTWEAKWLPGAIVWDFVFTPRPEARSAE
ncbi:MAG: WD40/YVTN/BNR-like repeat-containing protein [Opitutales bacterium]